MTASDEGLSLGSAKTLAAVMAAVEAYLEQESDSPPDESLRLLSPWKTEPWRVLRGGGVAVKPSWRLGR